MNINEQHLNLTRRAILRAAGVGAATVASGAILPTFALAEGTFGKAIGDGDILTFALNLEYLEAEFYSMATTGQTLGHDDIDGESRGSATTGGRQVNFSNGNLAKLAREIAKDELEHVRFLRTALGGNAIGKPAINLDALGIGFASDQEFIILARAFEDVGVSAYRGAAKLIANKDYLDAAAGILATEAYHAGHLRSHAIYANIENIAKLDGKDIPPSPDHWVPTDENGIAIGRTPSEVGKIVRGSSESGAFFPMGMNGKIR